MNTAQCELGRALIAFPNTVYNSIHFFFLYEVSHAAKLQAEMTKTKTHAELHRSREPDWCIHRASWEIDCWPRLPEKHSITKAPHQPPNKHTLSKKPHEQQRFVLPQNVEESWERRKDSMLEEKRDLSHKRTSMYFCGLL